MNVIGGVLGGIGELIGTIQSAQAAQEASEISQENLQWLKEMQYKQWQREDNAVQRRAIDLALAGINPMLAGVQGANSTLSVTNLENPAEYRMQGSQMVQQGFSNIADMSATFEGLRQTNAQTEANIKAINQTIKKDKATTNKILEETKTETVKQAGLKAGIELTNEQTKKIEQEIDNLIVQKQEIYQKIKNAKTQQEKTKLENQILELDAMKAQTILKIANVAGEKASKFYNELTKGTSNQMKKIQNNNNTNEKKWVKKYGKEGAETAKRYGIDLNNPDYNIF